MDFAEFKAVIREHYGRLIDLAKIDPSFCSLADDSGGCTHDRCNCSSHLEEWHESTFVDAICGSDITKGELVELLRNEFGSIQSRLQLQLAPRAMPGRTGKSRWSCLATLPPGHCEANPDLMRLEIFWLVRIVTMTPAVTTEEA
jgi:hypothetical protein